MKKLLLPLILLMFLFACEKNKPVFQKEVENLTYSTTIPGGCAMEDSINFKNDEFGPDTVYYTINEGELDIFVGFMANCCSHFTQESFIRNDSIFIKIFRKEGPLCGCVCYFTYDFIYSGIVYPHYYSVNIDDYMFFTGMVEP